MALSLLLYEVSLDQNIGCIYTHLFHEVSEGLPAQFMIAVYARLLLVVFQYYWKTTTELHAENIDDQAVIHV
jgi:hypothetical protein